MKVEQTPLAGVLLIEPDVFGDARGFFCETWAQPRYAALGIEGPFVQDNLSSSPEGVLRGLHLQHPNGQGKLVHVLAGEVFDVAVDVRVGSPTFGRWFGTRLSADNHRQLWIPPGFAHGFCVPAGGGPALFAYKCTALYDKQSELGVAWDDADLAIAWPVPAPTLSPKDAAYPRLRDIPRERLPSVSS